jgi:allantoin racemase
MHIRVINAVTRKVLGDEILPPLPDFIRAETVWLEEGPASIECRCDKAVSVPAVLEQVKKAGDDGVDGIAINCFMDPGLQAARELVRIPVAGPAESAMLLASSLGQNFAVILPAASGVPIVVDEAVSYGVKDQLISVRSVEIPVAELSDHDRLTEGLVRQAEKALTEDGAHSIILGCTGMCTVTAEVRRKIRRQGFDVPVIDPTQAAVGMLAALHVMGVCHSSRAYEMPSWRRT